MREASSTGPALPSPITARRFFILAPCSADARAATARSFCLMLYDWPVACDSGACDSGALDAMPTPDYTRARLDPEPPPHDEPPDAHLSRRPSGGALRRADPGAHRFGGERRLRHGLEGGGRAWRLLRGDRYRHLQALRAGGDAAAGRAAGQPRPAAGGRRARLQHRLELVRAAQFRAREHPDG